MNKIRVYQSEDNLFAFWRVMPDNTVQFREIKTMKNWTPAFIWTKEETLIRKCIKLPKQQ